MDTRVEWQKEYNIGVERIDRDHKKLFKIINKIFSFKDDEAGHRWVCQEGIKFFKGHTVQHFADEEAYMISVGYAGFDEHRKVHRNFRENTLPALEHELERTDYSKEAIDHFLGVCVGWLIGHTLTEDMEIIGRPVRKWENLLPREEINATEEVIDQLVRELFRLNARMVSDAYNGEKFGEGVYYDLIYGTGEEKRKQEIILVFEEKLLINTVGKVMGMQSQTLDTMLVHAARYVARQFVRKIMEHFPAMKAYELKGERFLSYEQFQKVLGREKMQLSLLFSVEDAGYFAYCVIAPHLLEKGVGRSIEAENALDEVDQYLMMRKEQEEKEKKKKILVVDDSMMMRQSMIELLGKDYEVSVVESGVAAIRVITLNRPDLILLDYEMPVVDGKQTLEMLRSEKDFAAIPVIFLTGRGDAQSVKNVLDLKPAGYLLKYLKPEEIKKNIDDFFQN